MTKTITISDELFGRLAALARPFLDKEPADVIGRLVESATGTTDTRAMDAGSTSHHAGLIGRAPRERGAIVELDGTRIQADTVSDLCLQVMEYMHSNKHWEQVLRLAPYKTSAQRYLFAKTDKHPRGNDFVKAIQCHGLYIETHKNYQTAIAQLAKFAAKCGVTLIYKGT